MTHSLVCLCLLLIGPWPRFAPGNVVIVPVGADDRPDIAACRKFVSEFYTWYLVHGKNQDPLRVALKQKRANFSGELIRRLNEDYAAAAKSPNEIVGLDFDPVLNSQDFADRYVPDKVTRKGGRFLVDLFAVYDGKRGPVAAVTAELRHDSGRWVFTNFLYKYDGKPDDLLSLLKRLKADRKKGK